MVDEKTRTELNLKLIINLKLNENGNKNEQTILDTASEINLISLKLVKKMKIENQIKITKQNIFSLGGNAITNHGKIYLKINNTKVKFIVVDKVTQKENLLIGWKCLLKNNFSLVCVNGNCLVKLFNSTMNVIKYKSDENIKLKNFVKVKMTEIRSVKEILMKPNTQQLIQVKIEKEFLKENEKENIFVCPCSTLKETPLKIASGFISKTKTNELYISNWSDEEIKIKKNALLGYATVNIYEVMTLEEVKELPDSEEDEKIYFENSNKSYSKKDFIDDLNILLEKNKNEMNENESCNLIKFLEKWKHFAVDTKNPGTTTTKKCFANTYLHITNQMPTMSM